MKLQLLLSTALMLLSVVSGASSESKLRSHSVDEVLQSSPAFSEDSPVIVLDEEDDESERRRRPTPRPTRRRPNRRPGRRPTPRPTRRVDGQDLYNDGLKDGRREANRLWRQMGGDCANAWGQFESRTKRTIRQKGWDTNGRNWKESTYNKGAKKGMEEVVKEKEKECLHDNPDECIGLGEAASSIISHEYCGMGSAYSHSNYKRTCRSVAISHCQGSVFGKVRSACGSPNTSTLRNLQGKCRRQVDSLLGINNTEKGFSDERNNSIMTE